jgi:hypothetical protein
MCIIFHKLFATGYLLETHLHDGPLNPIGPIYMMVHLTQLVPIYMMAHLTQLDVGG